MRSLTASYPSPVPAGRRRPSVRRAALITLGVVGLLVLVALIPVAGALGFFGQRTYLLLIQNSTELRPYGGFIGVYGELDLKYGRLVHAQYGDTLELDRVYDERLEKGEIDEIEQHQLYAPGDSPDFPTTAKEAAWIYA